MRHGHGPFPARFAVRRMAASRDSPTGSSRVQHSRAGEGINPAAGAAVRSRDMRPRWSGANASAIWGGAVAIHDSCVMSARKIPFTGRFVCRAHVLIQACAHSAVSRWRSHPLLLGHHGFTYTGSGWGAGDCDRVWTPRRASSAVGSSRLDRTQTFARRFSAFFVFECGRAVGEHVLNAFLTLSGMNPEQR